MNTKRIEEIQKETAYPDSISVQHALFRVWRECEQEKVVKSLRIADVSCQREQLLAFAAWLFGGIDKEVERMIVDDYLKGK